MFVLIRFIVDPYKEMRARFSNLKNCSSTVKARKELFAGSNSC